MSMTRATFVFPAIAGALRSTVGVLARKSPMGGEIRSCVWLTFFLSLGFLSLCGVYLLLQAVVMLITSREGYFYHFQFCLAQLRFKPSNAICFLTGVCGALEFFLLVWASTLEPHLSVALIMTIASQLLLLLALAADSFGLCWMPLNTPSEQTFLGGVLVFLGLLLIQALGLDFGGSRWILVRYVMATGAGFFAFFSLSFARQASSCFASYWAGTATNACGQVVFLGLLAICLDPKLQLVGDALDIFQDKSQTVLFVLSSLGLYVGFASVQFFGDTGGYYSAFAPLAAALVVVPLCMELSSLSYELQSIGAIAYTPTVSLMLAVLALVGGALLMWVGRWDFDDANDADISGGGTQTPGHRNTLKQKRSLNMNSELAPSTAGPHSAPAPAHDIPSVEGPSKHLQNVAPASAPLPKRRPSALLFEKGARGITLFQHPQAGKPIRPGKQSKRAPFDERCIFVVTPSNAASASTTIEHRPRRATEGSLQLDGYRNGNETARAMNPHTNLDYPRDDSFTVDFNSVRTDARFGDLESGIPDRSFGRRSREI